MGNGYRLVGLKNSELLTGLSELVQRSQEITAEGLAHLAEIEDRMLHLELGFASLFAYCVEALGMSEGSAGRRVAAARVCRRFPEAFEHVARGDLHLSALCALSPRLKPENASELFEECRRKSRRQIDELLAARFPRGDVREQIRRLPVRAQVPAAMSESFAPQPKEERAEAVGQPNAMDQRDEAASTEAPEIGSNQGRVAGGPPKSGAAQVGSGAPRPREIEPLSAERFGVHFTADAELRELIERARALASHRLPKGDLASLMKLALETLVQHEEKRRFAVGRRPRKVRGGTTRAGAPSTPRSGASARPPSPERTVTPGAHLSRTSKRSRYVSAAVTREVYQRDRKQCSFVSANGRRCGARAFLELDHVEPWARLGDPVVENIRVLCRAHNQLYARNCFGKKHVIAKIAARRDEANQRKNES